MTRGYLVRQSALGALAVNALRPASNKYGSVASFFPGWLTAELAPQLLAVSLADTALELSRRRGKHTAVGLAVGAATAGLLGSLIRGAWQTPAHVEEALTTGLGADYADLLDPEKLDMSVPFTQIARPFRLKSPMVEVKRNLPYTEGGVRARLDIYRPRGVELDHAPVLVQIHGGGWTISSKNDQGLILMNRMAERGWVCVAVNYRLAPKHLWPKQIIDVKRAIAWVHENIAEYGGDPEYVVTTGGSAGGHLSALAAVAQEPEWQPGFEHADTTVVGCVPFYGVYDMAGMTGDRAALAMRDDFLAKWLFKRDPEANLDEFVKASPLAHVGPGAPDFFVIHGRNDSLVSVRQARAFVAALREKSKASVTYLELPGTQHAFEVFSSIRSQNVIRGVQRWLEWHREIWLAENRSSGELAGKAEDSLGSDVSQDLRGAARD